VKINCDWFAYMWSLLWLWFHYFAKWWRQTSVPTLY